MSLYYPSPRPTNNHSHVQLHFLSLCRLQQLATPSRVTVVLVSLILAAPAEIFRLWLVILPARVAILCPEECWCDHVDCSRTSLKNIPSLHLTDVRELVLNDNSLPSLQNDNFVSRGLADLEDIHVLWCELEAIQLGAFKGKS
jgi:hypothetical protein